MLCDDVSSIDQIYVITERVSTGKQKLPAVVNELVQKYSDVFKEELEQFPPNRTIKHSTNTGDNELVAVNQYRLSPLEKETVENNVKKLLRNGFIQKSTSPWSAPILFV